MSILNNHSAFNKWKTLGGCNQKGNGVLDYSSTKKYIKELNEELELSYSIKELLVKNINSMKGAKRYIYVSDIEDMINRLNSVKSASFNKFKVLRQTNGLIEAFKYLYKLTY